MKAYDSVN
jgi:hypothetical protein